VDKHRVEVHRAAEGHRMSRDESLRERCRFAFALTVAITGELHGPDKWAPRRTKMSGERRRVTERLTWERGRILAPRRSKRRRTRKRRRCKTATRPGPLRSASADFGVADRGASAQAFVAKDRRSHCITQSKL